MQTTAYIHLAEVRLPDVLLVMSLIFEKPFVVLEYFPASIKFLNTCEIVYYWTMITLNIQVSRLN